MGMLRKCRIEVEGFGSLDAGAGELFLEVLNARGLDLHNDCGGFGKCGKCRIVFLSPAPDTLESDRAFMGESELAEGQRLACFHQVRGDCRIIIPEPPEMELLDDLE